MTLFSQKFSALIILISGFFLLFSCSKKESIRIGGSSTVLPVVSKAAEKYRSMNPDKSVIVNSGGSGVGINQVGKGQLDIGMASRAITDKEKQNYPEVDFLVHTIGKDAVIPVVSHEIFSEGITALSVQQIRDIYEGRVSNWNKLGGPDREILVIDKEAFRGTRHAFMEVILNNPEASAPGADIVLGSNNEVQMAVSQSNAAIGFLSFAWQTDEVKALGFIRPDNTIIEPTEKNLQDGLIPTVRELMLITDGQPEGEADDFISFILSDEGQKIVQEAGYVSISR